MDNLCHTLAGAALARAGLGRRTALGTAALVLGANLPDLDVVSAFLGRTSDLAFRRGWTHGVLAMAVWPFVLTTLLLAWDRWRRRSATLVRAKLDGSPVPGRSSGGGCSCYRGTRRWAIGCL